MADPTPVELCNSNPGPMTTAWLAAQAAVEQARATSLAAEQTWQDDDSAHSGDTSAPSYVAWIAADADLASAEAEYRRATHALYVSAEPCEYTLRDGDSGVTVTITANSDKDARRQAREWAHEGDYNDPEGTIWVDVYVVDLEGDEDCVTVAIDPKPPACEPGHEHDWRSPLSVVGGIEENPGVWGSGGGVKMKEVCRHCGAYRMTNTWAHRPDTGEQGLTSVYYEDADDDSLAWVEAGR